MPKHNHAYSQGSYLHPHRQHVNLQLLPPELPLLPQFCPLHVRPPLLHRSPVPASANLIPIASSFSEFFFHTSLNTIVSSLAAPPPASHRGSSCWAPPPAPAPSPTSSRCRQVARILLVVKRLPGLNVLRDYLGWRKWGCSGLVLQSCMFVPSSTCFHGLESYS